MGKDYNIMEWMVVIEGEEIVLEDLSLSFIKPDLTITKHQGNYVIKSEQFNRLNSSDEVRVEAEKCLLRLNGILKLMNISNINIEQSYVIRLDKNGTSHIHAVAMSCVSLSSGACDITHRNANGSIVPISKKVPGLFALCNDDSVAMAIELWQHDSESWYGLYKVYEFIRGDIINKLEPEIVDELERFTQTANSYDSIGKDARHSPKYMPHKNPMPLPEAKALINKLMRHWISQKLV